MDTTKDFLGRGATPPSCVETTENGRKVWKTVANDKCLARTWTFDPRGDWTFDEWVALTDEERMARLRRNLLDHVTNRTERSPR